MSLQFMQFPMKKMLSYITFRVIPSINFHQLFPYVVLFLPIHLSLLSQFLVVDYVTLLNIYFKMFDMHVLFLFYYLMQKCGSSAEHIFLNLLYVCFSNLQPSVMEMICCNCDQIDSIVLDLPLN